ncbi:MAG: thioredoxin family protein [Ignavibacteriales bacterium]|nr:thioredoxin family protein [Ignavibacteriales bacterium]
MDLFFTIVIILIGIFTLFQFFMYLKSKRSVGKIIPYDMINSEIWGKIKNKKSVLYFHSPSCHNCKVQTPIIEKLKNEFNCFLSIDVSKDLQTAKAFGIMGTPSLIFLGTKTIEGFYVGVKDENFIREKLKSLV